MALDVSVLARRGVESRLAQIVAAHGRDVIVEVAELLMVHITLSEIGHNGNGQSAARSSTRQAGELEMELDRGSVAARVAKEMDIDRPRRPKKKPTPPTPRPQTVAARLSKRQETANFLAACVKPISIEDLRKAGIVNDVRATIASLVRYKYLRRKGDMFHRTKKHYAVDPRQADV